MDKESTESSCSDDSDLAVKTSISMEFQKREKDLNPLRGWAQTLAEIFVVVYVPYVN